MRCVGWECPCHVAVFARSFQTQLTAVLGYDAVTAKQITKTAKPKYKEIIAKLPEFEKGDRFQLNIIGCAMLGAFVLCMPQRPDAERLRFTMRTLR